jgi:hypothetical protein
MGASLMEPKTKILLGADLFSGNALGGLLDWFEPALHLFQNRGRVPDPLGTCPAHEFSKLTDVACCLQRKDIFKPCSPNARDRDRGFESSPGATFRLKPRACDNELRHSVADIFDHIEISLSKSPEKPSKSRLPASPVFPS